MLKESCLHITRTIAENIWRLILLRNSCYFLLEDLSYKWMVIHASSVVLHWRGWDWFWLLRSRQSDIILVWSSLDLGGKTLIMMVESYFGRKRWLFFKGKKCNLGGLFPNLNYDQLVIFFIKLDLQIFPLLQSKKKKKIARMFERKIF